MKCLEYLDRATALPPVSGSACPEYWPGSPLMRRQGTWFVAFRQNARRMVACLHQARALDYRRLPSKLGSIDDDEDFTRVKDGFRNLYP